MPTFQSRKFLAPQMMSGDGRALVNTDAVAVPASLATNDTIEFPLPAGFELSELSFQFDDLDSTTAQAWQAGFAPVQSETAITQNLTYFAAASTITAGRTGGRHLCSFKPIKFNEDVKIVLTCNAAGTPAAGEVHAIMVGAAVGVR